MATRWRRCIHCLLDRNWAWRHCIQKRVVAIVFLRSQAACNGPPIAGGDIAYHFLIDFGLGGDIACIFLEHIDVGLVWLETTNCKG